MMAANRGRTRCQKAGANLPQVSAGCWVGSKGLCHPPLTQHLHWLSLSSLLAPIFQPQVSATLHRPQTVFYPFDSQSQSAAEPKSPTGRKGLTTGACSLLLPCSGSRNQAGQLEAVPPAPASGSGATASPWAPPLYRHTSGDRDFVPLPVTWWLALGGGRGGFGYGVRHKL